MLALYDVGQRRQDALLAVGHRADEPAALHDAVRVQILAVVFDERLQRDPPVGVARPVGQRPPGRIGADLGATGELLVATVERIRHPGAVGAVEARVVLEDVQQDAVELSAASVDRRGGAVGRVDDRLQAAGHRARRVEGGIDLRADVAGLGRGEPHERLLGHPIEQPVRVPGDVIECAVRGHDAVGDQSTGSGDHAGRRQGDDAELDGTELHDVVSRGWRHFATEGINQTLNHWCLWNYT